MQQQVEAATNHWHFLELLLTALSSVSTQARNRVWSLDRDPAGFINI